jgi:putative ABC transport system permease protein
MVRITLRDLQWRARRFGLGVAATALVFATTLLLVGVHSSFLDETTRAVDAFAADRWIVPRGVSGPFTNNSPMAPGVERRVSGAAGVRASQPLALFSHVVRDEGGAHNVNVIAYDRGHIFAPPITSGREPERRGEVAVDRRLEASMGERLRIADETVEVVGLTTGLTYFGGAPAMLMPLAEGRRIYFGGEPLSTTIITRGAPDGPLRRLDALGREPVVEDLRRPLAAATTTIGVLVVILWLVAAGIIGLMVYLAGLDRRVDFAVFKATGARNGPLLAGVVLQALLLALCAAGLAAAAASLVAPSFPIQVSLSAGSYALLVGVAVGVGLAVSAVSVRQATGVDPALAFGRN